jgi:hypothetical protein
VTWKRSVLFAAFAFLTGLIRPDGVILAGLMLLSVLYGTRKKGMPVVLCFTLIFLCLGGPYFLWRLHYFGYAFPNPYYIKHGVGIHLVNIKISTRLLSELLLPSLPLLGLGVLTPATRKQLVLLLITLVPFISVWMLILMDNNHYARFQYVLVPLTILSIGGIAITWWRSVSASYPGDIAALRRSVVATVSILLFYGIFYNMHLDNADFSNLGAQQLALRIKPYHEKNYTLVTTESGDLPFYSEWRTVDAAGLNDAWIAHHHGQISEDYIDQYKPEIIMYNTPFEKGLEAVPAAAAKQFDHSNMLASMDNVLRDYAVQHGYIRAAVYGAHLCQFHVFWVRPDFPDRDAILSDIRDYPYYMQGYGLLAHDWRNDPPQTIPCAVGSSPY